MRCDCHVHIVGPVQKYPQVPDRTYLAGVAKQLNTTADALRGKSLKSVDPAAFGAAIQVQEGWHEGKSLGLADAIKDSTLPAPSRFRLLYTKLAGGVS